MRKCLFVAALLPLTSQTSAQPALSRGQCARLARPDRAYRPAASLGDRGRPNGFRTGARVRSRGRRVVGAVAGQPVLIKDNIETAGPLPTPPKPGAGEQCDRPRRAIGSRLRSARSWISSARPTFPNGRTSARTIRSPAGARSAARCATPMRSTAIPAEARAEARPRWRRASSVSPSAPRPTVRSHVPPRSTASSA